MGACQEVALAVPMAALAGKLAGLAFHRIRLRRALDRLEAALPAAES